ncbi:endonuclease domain-containing 1 protein-like isoform X2 [Erpetoichthys calabaricus]|uniref:endonuclease domain-containing 1 protein-like isoform X2 n=1 Tax=Erpetoichthys calabaricus TaxID=27687 RepID=UPI0022340C6F|nr:endonuclease domain-containing 1 protein-like isoform X2 [Erpetoichthys calabaricus]
MLLLVLMILRFLTTQGNFEVMKRGEFTCREFFHKQTEPKGLVPDKAARICQTYKNKVHFATMYDRENRIPIYSAYKYESGGPRPYGTWYLEPQLADQTKDKNMMEETKELTEKLKESQAVSEDYKSIYFYDRGHLSPSVHHKDEDSKEATFTLTNVVPQFAALNNGKWGIYESEKMKTFVNENKCAKTYVIVGVTRGDKIKNRINKPSHLWTVACCVDQNERPMKFFGYIAENDKNEVESISLEDLQKKLKEAFNEDVHLFADKCGATFK